MLVAIVVYLCFALPGIRWGLPSRDIDRFLFRDEPPWSGEKIYRLAKASEKFEAPGSASRGADVDADPIATSRGASSPEPGVPNQPSVAIDRVAPILLTGTDEDVARILLRYRLYTHQPDEMITLMALAGMRPRSFDFDPRLYQYGGLFIYPVGALLGVCDALGLIDVRGDVTYYLDHPDEFGKFYVVSRAYSAAWGLVGVIVVFAIARRLGGVGAGWLAATLFAMLPVVVCMAHEGKPHLPGAVLMLIAVWLAMRCVGQRGGSTTEPRHKPEGTDHSSGTTRARPTSATARRAVADVGIAVRDNATMHEGAVAHGGIAVRDNATMHEGAVAHGGVVAVDGTETHGKVTWMLLCAACGAAVGMVLSSWPIFVLIPLVAWRTRPLSRVVIVTIAGAAIGLATYLVSNPYIVINLLAHREVLQSNFGNSLAMYEIARVGEGFVRVAQLTMEGATLPVLAVGAVMMLLLMFRALRRSPGNVSFSPGEPRASARADSPSQPAPMSTRRPKTKSSVVPAATPPWECLVFPAALLFAQFVLIGAGKPAEYGRFGVFTNTALVIAAAAAVHQWVRAFANRRGPRAGHALHVALCLTLLVPATLYGGGYTANFIADARGSNSRRDLARVFEAARIDESTGRLLLKFATIAEPAPYNFPPIPFHRADVLLLPTPPGDVARSPDRDMVLIEPLDRTRSVVPAHSAPLADVIEATMPDLFDSDAAVRLADLDWRRRPPWGLARFNPRLTPISWANKPFHNSLFEWKARGADPPILRPKATVDGHQKP